MRALFYLPTIRFQRYKNIFLAGINFILLIIGAFPGYQYDHRNDHICVNDPQCAETKEKSILQFLRFLVFGLWAILFTIRVFPG